MFFGLRPVQRECLREVHRMATGKKIKKNKVSVSAPGKHKIAYVVDGTVIVDRIIEARDK